MREKPYAMSVFERTEPTVMPSVMITELSANRKNGMKLTASGKFCHTHVSGMSVGGTRVPSRGDFTALMSIQ
jgi:hypothetical protein